MKCYFRWEKLSVYKGFIFSLTKSKLGLIAQSCFAPGFSTLIANVFTMRGNSSGVIEEEWKNFYLLGTGYEMYSEQLSPTFTGMAFEEAAE